MYLKSIANYSFVFSLENSTSSIPGWDLMHFNGMIIPAVLYHLGGTLSLLILGMKGRSQRAYNGENCGQYRTETVRERAERQELKFRVTRKVGGCAPIPG